MTPQSETPAANDLSARVRALAPLIAQHAEQAERERKPADAVIAALAETGAF